MARVFLSYARDDAEDAAEDLRSKINLAGHIVWRDREDMKGGISWQDQINRAIENVHCVIVLLTPKGVASKNVTYEWQVAIERGKRVIPVQILPCEVPDELRRLHYHTVTDLESYQKMLMVVARDLTEIDTQLAVHQSLSKDIPEDLIAYVRNSVKAYDQQLKDLHQLGVARVPDEPYKELYPFEITDEQIFFGRDTDSKQLKRVVALDRIAVLHARSGAGKTSLINAGLMPRLITAGYIPIYARAHTDPIEEVKRVVSRAVPQKTPTSLSKLTLHQFLRIAESALELKSKEFVIILDQFEEFFVLYPHPEQRLTFINALGDCYDDKTLRVRFLLALRKDYFSDLGEFQDRIPNIFRNEYRLPILTRDQAMDAIVGPVRAVDSSVSYEQTLLQELLADLETSGMELPHLQIICSQLYDRPDSSALITLSDYEKYGRAKGILGNYLKKTLASFPVAERDLARSILVELVSSQSTRRILSYETLLASIHAEPQQIDGVLNKLLKARLLRIDKDEEAEQTLYEMAHEYLVDEISKWFDSGLMAVKQTQELLQRAVIDWKLHNILISRPILERIYQERESLGVLTDDALLALLLSSIEENFEIRFWLSYNEGRSFDLLKAYIKEEKWPVRQRAKIIARLVNFGEKVIPFLIELLDSTDELIQKRALQVLEQFTANPAATHSAYEARLRTEQKEKQEKLAKQQRDQQEKELKQQQEKEQRTKQRGVQQEKIESADIPTLLSMLQSSNSQTVREAIARLGVLRVHSATSDLEEILLHGMLWETRQAAAVALGKIKSPNSLKALEKAATSDPVEQVRISARQAQKTFPKTLDEMSEAGETLLGGMDPMAWLESLARRQTDTSNEPVKPKPASIPDTKAPQAKQPPIVSALVNQIKKLDTESPEPIDPARERYNAIIATIKLYEKNRNVDALIKTLNEPVESWSITWQVVDALERINTPEAIAALEAWRNKQSPT